MYIEIGRFAPVPWLSQFNSSTDTNENLAPWVHARNSAVSENSSILKSWSNHQTSQPTWHNQYQPRNQWPNRNHDRTIDKHLTIEVFPIDTL
jgi:hypothetical protein